MAEYIEKRAAIAAVCEHCSCNHIEDCSCSETEEISAIPAADVVAVVRCKDCKHYREESFHCWLMRGKMSLNDYCSYGERREQ